MPPPTAHGWLEARFAAIRPKAMAALTRQFRDVDLAEEAFATASMRALKAWHEQGLPDDPFAWLLTVARNALLDGIRRRNRADVVVETSTPCDVEAAIVADLDQRGLADDVLRLMFICCHPALSKQDQLALALRIVAGMSVSEIARALLVKPKTMEQRLTRAKRTIAAADLHFETPDLGERLRRFKAVSLMLYLLFNEGWSASSGEIQIKAPLCEEAIRLARLLLDLFPGMSELMSLLALFLFQHSRREARLNDAGDLVPLERQDRSLWDGSMINEADVLLQKARRHQPIGLYQCQAAIAAEHAHAQHDDDTDWVAIERHYDALYAIEPSPVIRLNQAAALAKVEGPEAALAMIDPLGTDLHTYRWYHATRGALLFDIGAFGQAETAYQQALASNPTLPERRFLEARIQACQKKSPRLSG